MNHNPIGIFDSGAGGLSVLKEIIKICPTESVVYFADTANCPYGSKSAETIIAFSKKIVEFLLEQRCKIIVVACNTATAAAIDFLRANYSTPFIGMEPAIKPAALNTKTKNIGVLATAGTFKGKLYIETSNKYASGVNVCYQIGEGLVELVESTSTETPQAESLIRKYVEPMIQCNIDHLVLGCTHYPFLIDTIRKVIPQGVQIIDPAPSVAKQCLHVLDERNLACNNNSNPTYHFYSSSTIEALKQIAENKVLPHTPHETIFHEYTKL